MMFPGHPYLRQETRRAEHDGETQERERVLRLIRKRIASAKRHNSYDVEDALKELWRAVHHGHQQ